MVKKMISQDANGDNKIKGFSKIWSIGEKQTHKSMTPISDLIMNLYNYYNELIQFKSFTNFWEYKIGMTNANLTKKSKFIMKSVKNIMVC